MFAGQLRRGARADGHVDSTGRSRWETKAPCRPLSSTTRSLSAHAGNWPLAARHAAEGFEHAEQTGRQQDMSALLSACALVDAHLGRVEQAREAPSSGGSPSRRVVETRVFRLQHLRCARLSKAVARRCCGRRQDPSGRWQRNLLRPGGATGVSTVSCRTGSKRYVELGEFEEARRLLANPRDRVQPGSRTYPGVRRAPSRCEGMILVSRRATSRLRSPHTTRALTVHERLPQPLDLAHTLLAKGSRPTTSAEEPPGRARRSGQALAAASRELGAACRPGKPRAELARIGGRRGQAAGEKLDAERTPDRGARGRGKERQGGRRGSWFVTESERSNTALTQIYPQAGRQARAKPSSPIARRCRPAEQSQGVSGISSRRRLLYGRWLMPSYLMESYAAVSAVDAQRERARLAAELGTDVRHLRTTFLPGDETILHVFEAESARSSSRGGTSRGAPR